jgi:hypothetical protein
MRKFFQGLVLGACLMYWYLYYGAETLATFRDWLNRTGGQYREDQRHEEAEKALQGFLLHRDWHQSEEQKASG